MFFPVTKPIMSGRKSHKSQIYQGDIWPGKEITISTPMQNKFLISDFTKKKISKYL